MVVMRRGRSIVNTPVLVRREEFGLGDGVGFIMDFICGVVERYAGDFYIAVFMCYVGHLLVSHP